MASNDRAEGPSIGQTVLYNNSGAIVPAVIYAVAVPAGTVSLVYFDASGATNVTGKGYDGTRATAGTWSYMSFM